MLNHKEWIEKQWPSMMFFDPRIHARAIFIALTSISFPTSSIAKRFQSLSATKRCYRFLDRKDMAHQKL